MGCPVSVGLAGADDGGTAVVEVGTADVLPEAVGLAVALWVADGVGVAVGAAELVVGDGDGGPKQPVSAIRAESPITLNTGSLGLVMMPL